MQEYILYEFRHIRFSAGSRYRISVDEAASPFIPVGKPVTFGDVTGSKNRCLWYIPFLPGLL